MVFTTTTIIALIAITAALVGMVMVIYKFLKDTPQSVVDTMSAVQKSFSMDSPACARVNEELRLERSSRLADNHKRD